MPNGMGVKKSKEDYQENLICKAKNLFSVAQNIVERVGWAIWNLHTIVFRNLSHQI